MDDDLIPLLHLNDGRAFRTAVCRHQDRLVRIGVRMLGDRGAAEDAAQDAFVRLWMVRDRLDRTHSLQAYVVKVMTNLCLDRLRTRRDSGVALREDDASPVEPPDRSAERTLLAEAVRAALLSLPDDQRAAFVLTHYEGLTYAEAAEVLNCPVGTVASRKQAACAVLRRRLAAWGGDE